MIYKKYIFIFLFLFACSTNNTSNKDTKIVTNVGVDSFNIDTNRVEVKLSNKEVIHSSLMIAADGRLSSARRSMGIPSEVKDFGKTVIVCKMEHEKPHKNVAYEFCHPQMNS